MKKNERKNYDLTKDEAIGYASNEFINWYSAGYKKISDFNAGDIKKIKYIYETMKPSEYAELVAFGLIKNKTDFDIVYSNIHFKTGDVSAFTVDTIAKNSNNYFFTEVKSTNSSKKSTTLIKQSFDEIDNRFSHFNKSLSLTGFSDSDVDNLSIWGGLGVAVIYSSRLNNGVTDARNYNSIVINTNVKTSTIKKVRRALTWTK